MSKALLIKPEVLVNLSAFEKARYEYIVTADLKRTNSKQAEKVKKSYVFRLEEMQADALEGIDKNDADAVKVALDKLAVSEEYQKVANNFHDKMLAFEQEDTKYSNTIKKCRDTIKAYCDEWISDNLYQSYIKHKDCVDFKEEMRRVVTKLGFGRVQTADDKPFNTFCDMISFQKKIDRKHVDQHTKCLNKMEFKELVIGIICDYIGDVGGYYFEKGEIVEAC